MRFAEFNVMDLVINEVRREVVDRCFIQVKFIIIIINKNVVKMNYTN